MKFRNPVIKCDVYPFELLRKSEKEKYVWNIDVVQHVGGELTQVDFVAVIDDFDSIDEFKIAIVKTLAHFYQISWKEASEEGSQCFDFKHLCQQVLFSHFIDYYDKDFNKEEEFFELLSDNKYLISCLYTMITNEIMPGRFYMYLSCERTEPGGSDDYDIDIRIIRKKVVAYNYPFDSRKFVILATNDSGAGSGAGSEEEMK